MLGYVALKCCDRLAGACQCWSNNVGICYIEMFRSFMWPELANAGPTMLGYVVLKCCDRLAGACKCWSNNVGICCVETLRSFDRSLQMLGQQYWDMLR